ncbi:hypothetical protein KPL74_13250 [Bacillus sp. NP157]|nr:hypothetical protein KPL74_13250 [Bacillus sp. NP157]
MSHPAIQPSNHRSAFPAFVLLFLVMAYKANDALTIPQFFAEDVSIFFKGQLGHVLPQVWVPYAGYLHFIPRVVAWIGSWFGSAKAPLVYNLAAVALSAGAISYTCHRFRDIVPLPLAMLTFIAVPVSGEILGTITNAQWFLQFVIAAACLTEPSTAASGRRRWLRDACLLAIALTGPFSIMLVILLGGIALASLVDRRAGWSMFGGQLANWTARVDRRAVAAVAVGAVVQVGFVLGHAPEKSEAQRGVLELLRITLTDLAPIHTFGKDFLTGNGWLVVYAIGVVALVRGGRMEGRKRLAVLAMLAFACAEMFAPVRLKEVEPLYQFLLSDRYFYVFKVVFWWAVYAAIVTQGSLSRADAARIVTLFVALVAAGNIDHLRRPPFADLHWKQTARELRSPGPHTVFTNPPGWGVIIDGPPADPSKTQP